MSKGGPIAGEPFANVSNFLPGLTRYRFKVKAENAECICRIQNSNFSALIRVVPRATAFSSLCG